MAKSIPGGVEIVNTLSTKNDGNYPLVKAESVGMADGTTAEDNIKKKLDKNQGTQNNGKFMRVGADGNLIPDDVPIPDVSRQIKEHNENTDSHQDIRKETAQLKEDIVGLDNRKADAIVETASGNPCNISDSSGLLIKKLNIYGESTQNGVPSLDAPIPIVNVGEKGNINITIDGQPQQKLYISTPNGLPGIKVDTGGNYTDSTGQQWICDEIDLARGKYIQRIYKNILDGTETWKTWGVGNGTPDNTGFYFNSNEDQHMLNRAAMSNVLPYNTGAWNGANVGCNAGPYIMMSVKNSDLLDTTTNEKALQSFKNYLAQQKEKGTPVIFYRALKIPVERDLTPEEIQAFKALHTNYPTTVITNDENTGMEVSYIADTKHYIDKKFEELNQAIVNTQIALL